MFHTYKQMIFEVNLPNGQSDFTVNLCPTNLSKPKKQFLFV